MRIQHNIMAMNAYRNYNANNKALSGNLEKLSSGYKINRAGDDAAGLAISEKMRAQITGLNAASKNVKDGTSLVKTAEGAMQEIQDMLNRMDYLATQSANGTYDNEVDRANLQKEVEALKTEINRIADSANFNGIKLLDGSLDGSTTAVDAAAAAAKNVKAIYNDADAAAIKSLMLKQSTSNDPNNATDGVGKATILETDGTGETVPSFKVSLNGMDGVIGDPAGTETFKISIDDNGTAKNLSVTEAQIAAAAGATKAGEKVTSADLAKAIADQTANKTIQLDGVTYDITADGENLVFTAQTNPTTEKNAHFKVTVNNGITSTNVNATKDTYKSGAITVDAGAAAGEDISVKISYTDADGNAKEKEVTYKTEAGKLAATDIAAGLIAAINADDDLKGLFTASGADTGIILTAKEAGAGKGTVTGVAIGTAGTATKLTVGAGGDTTVEGADAYVSGVNGYSNFGTQDIKVNVAGTKDELASTTIDLTGLLKDGTKIKLGDEEYVIAIGPDSKYKDAEGAVLVAEGATEAQIASALTDAADKNGTFTVGHEAGSPKITLKQKAEVKDSTDMSTMDKFASYIGISQVDTAKTEAAQKAADEALAAAQNKQGKPLTLQIGDTSDPFNQMEVSVGDMHVNAMFGLQRDATGNLVKDADGNTIRTTDTIDSVDISTQEGAQKAVNVIKDAINYVSSVRGDLGAIQNRLDHTANNLSVMAENIQDAESTIRDTDVAEEMMSYVKNNILVQSAQAMLAQANQVPQGVLQLLG